MGSSEIQGELWSAAALDWVELQEPMHIPLFEAMMGAAEVGADTHFLDVGCGGGTASLLATEKGAQVSGIDAAGGLIEIARSRMPGCDFRIGDLETLPFDDDTFDVVFFANSLQYAEDRIHAMQEARRVCRSGGFVVVGLFGQPEDVDYRHIFKAVADSLPEPPPGDGPFGLSDRDKLKGIFEAIGIETMTHNEVNCAMVYPDTNTFWRAIRSGGPVISVLRTMDEDKLKQSVLEAIRHMTNGDGSINLGRNIFQYVVAQLN